MWVLTLRFGTLRNVTRVMQSFRTVGLSIVGADLIDYFLVPLHVVTSMNKFLGTQLNILR